MFNWFWSFLYGIIKAVLRCIDFILDFTETLCGIRDITIDGKETDITTYFLTQNKVLDAFILVAIIGFVLLFIFTAFSVLRAMARSGEGKSPVRVCIDSAKILLYFLLVPAIMILGAAFVTVIMRSLSAATSLSEGQSLGASMFSIFVQEAFNGGEGVGKEEILAAFQNGTLNYYDTDAVSQYFTLSEINYFLAFAGGISVLVLLVMSLVSFVERLISLVVLFIVSPLSMSSAALDDGVRFKLWRDQVINKFLIAYGALLSLNIFMLLLNVIYKIQFSDNAFWNSLAQLLFIIGGAAACRRGSVLIGNLVNSGAGTADMMDQAHANGLLNRVGHTALGAAAGVTGTVARGTGRAVMVPGRKLGHQIENVASGAYRNVRSKVSGGVTDLQDRFTGKVHRVASQYNTKESGNDGSPRSLKSDIMTILKGKFGSRSEKGSGASGAPGGTPPPDTDKRLNTDAANTIADALEHKKGGTTPPGITGEAPKQ